MTDSPPKKPFNSAKSKLSPEKYAKLRAEAKAPYKGFRKFFYVAFGASGFIGAFIFFAKLVSGQDIATNLPNFALQVGLVALMIFLFRFEK